MTQGKTFTAIFLLLSVLGRTTLAGDWPQFLGPNRDGSSSEEAILESWPGKGPKILWEKALGEGYSAPVVASSRAIIFHRPGSKAKVDCFEALSGKSIWSFEYTTDYRDDFGFDGGPRATPTVAESRVFTHGAEGILHAIDFDSGKSIWKVDTRARFSSLKGFFGRSCSPLVDGGRVFLNVGVRGAGLVAFEAASGEVIWKSSDHEASYSSPIAADIDGQRRIVCFSREGLLVTDPEDGEIQYTFRWRPRINASVNAATPLVVNDRVFLSTSYRTGAVLLKLGGKDPEKIWSSDEALTNHYATSVHHEGFLYGFHGRQEAKPALRCIELATGKLAWGERHFGAGTLIRAGKRLLIMKEDGELVLAAADPAGFKAIARARILKPTVRAYAALSNGLFYARDEKRLVCVDLRKNLSN